MLKNEKILPAGAREIFRKIIVFNLFSFKFAVFCCNLMFFIFLSFLPLFLIIGHCRETGSYWEKRAEQDRERTLNLTYFKNGL